MIFNYNDLKKSYKNLKNKGLSKEKRDKLNYSDILNIFELNDVKVEFLNSLKYIHNIITKNNLWKKQNIKSNDTLGTFLGIYLMENNSNEIYEYRTGLINLPFASRKFLNIFDKLFSFKNEDLMIKSGLLSLYVDYLYEYVNLEKIFKSHDYKSEKKGYIATLNLIVDELNDININSYKSIKRYKLLTLVELLRNRLINIKCNKIIYNFDLKNQKIIEEIKNASNSDFFVSYLDLIDEDKIIHEFLINLINNEQVIHEILIDSNYNEQINNDPNKLLFQKIFFDNLEKEISNNPPIYEHTINSLLKIKKGIIPISNSSIKITLDELINDNLIFQLENGIYEWENFINLFSNIINIICNIQENEQKIETEKLWSILKQKIEDDEFIIYSKKISLTLQFIVTQVNNLKIFLKNKTLKLIKEKNIKYLINHETKHFKINNIKKTNIWLKNILISNPELIKNVVENNDTRKIIILALVKISSEYKGIDCPETLLFDKERLYNLAIEFNKYILISKILVIISNYLLEQNIQINIINKVIFLITKVLLKLDIYNDIFIQKAITITSIIIDCKYLIDIETKINNFVSNKNDIITKELLNIWYKAIDEENIENVELLNVALFEPLWPNIVKSINLLNKMSKINIEVHGNLYNSIIKQNITS